MVSLTFRDYTFIKRKRIKVLFLFYFNPPLKKYLLVLEIGIQRERERSTDRNPQHADIYLRWDSNPSPFNLGYDTPTN